MLNRYPKRFGKYVLLKPLARGGMGEIYLAASGRAAAFRSSASSRRSSPRRAIAAKANRFLDEAKVVLRLSHANLVPTFDAGEVDGEFFIAMELVEGKDLREIWNRCVRTRTRIPLDVALHVGARDRPRAGLRAQLRRPAPGPPRRRAAQHPAQLLRRGEADRLRPGAQRAQAGAHRARRGVRPRVVPGARAGARRGRRRAHRHLQPGHRAVGAADRATSTCSSPTSTRRRRCRWCATRAPQPPSSKAPWITPELDALVMRALAPDARAALPVGRGDAPGAVRRDHPRLAARRRRARRRVPARPLRQRRTRSGPSATSCWPSSARAARRGTATPRRRPRMPVPLSPLDSGSTELQFPEGRRLAGRRLHRPGDRQPLPRAAQDRRGRHGHGLRRRARRDRQGRRDQDPAPASTRQQQDLVERFRREARAASRIGHPQHHRRHRLRHDRGRLRLLRDGAPRRHRSRRRAVARAAARSASAPCEIAHPDLPRAGGGARGRRHPPRPQAREHLPGRARRRGRLRQGARLRHRAQRRAATAPAHQPGHRDGHAGVHGARAGARAAPVDRRAATSTRSARCSTR